ncbi:hypothetical protein TcasGA2_TC007778 [Tribolium castaneum]|uniref:Uncharacterized protein n=1 Tax=Tribolium castaneum TaxID=7070 RepID=D2A1V0_TRICA|nr:hypothetical protein TcasGA2_TC007778 [Tribolium castaneum]
MSNQVNNMGQMCNNFSDEIAHGIRNLTDDNVNNKCDDESWYMENFNFPNDVQSTMSKTTMKRALNQPSTSRFDEFTNLQPSTSKATESDTLVNQIGAGQIDDNEVFENFADEFNFINKNGENESFIKKFNTLARRMRFSFKDNAPENPIEWMQRRRLRPTLLPQIAFKNRNYVPCGVGVETACLSRNRSKCTLPLLETRCLGRLGRRQPTIARHSHL